MYSQSTAAIEKTISAKTRGMIHHFFVASSRWHATYWLLGSNFFFDVVTACKVLRPDQRAAAALLVLLLLQMPMLIVVIAHSSL